jgi:hypothetical protein
MFIGVCGLAKGRKNAQNEKNQLFLKKFEARG